MRRGALAARCLALLGPAPGALAVVGSRPEPLATAIAARAPLAGPEDALAGAIVTFTGAAESPDQRQAVLAALRRRLAAGAPLVVVDHNQPRRWWGRAVGVLALALRGLPPARARYPTARELAALGFVVDRLDLAAGERLQLVAARRRE